LITPVFYGLERVIKTELEKSDYEVVWIENKVLKFDYHGTNSKFKLLRKIYFLLTFPRDRYIKNQLSIIDNKYFDVLFAINGHVICTYLIKNLKRKNPDLFTILYLWDSFKMYDWSEELNLFQRVITFDKEDSEGYRLEYKPIFFVTSDVIEKREEVYDLLFIGKFSSDRFYVIKNMISELNRSGIQYLFRLFPAYKIFIHNRFVYKLLKLFYSNTVWSKNFILNFEAVERHLDNEFVVEKSLSFEEFSNLSLTANAILDLPFKNQSGYSHRLIDALGKGKKVITTNRRIVDENFYNPEQIHLIDLINPVLNLKWIKERKLFSPGADLLSLELDEWLKSVLYV
jgi:hypothetical protein